MKVKCQYCDFEFNSVSEIGNHVRWKHKWAKSQRKCSYCSSLFDISNLGQHENSCKKRKECLVCNKLTNNEKYCSKSCSATANNIAGKIGYSVYRRKNNITKTITHRDVCFQYWEHKCVLCDWTISLDVHHIDENHQNNYSKNLIPLCQNHHMLTRMISHKRKIRIKLEKLVKRKMGL